MVTEGAHEGTTGNEALDVVFHDPCCMRVTLRKQGYAHFDFGAGGVGATTVTI